MSRTCEPAATPERGRVADGVVAILWAVWHAPFFLVHDSFRSFSPALVTGWLFGLACEAVVLGWLYERSGASILLVAVWHGAYSVVGGSAGAEGLVGAVVTTLVMVQAVALVVLEVRASRAGRSSVLGPWSAC